MTRTLSSPLRRRLTSVAFATTLALALAPAFVAPEPSAALPPVTAPAAGPVAPAAPPADPAPARAPLPDPGVEAPTPDLLNVDLDTGSLTDTAADRTSKTFGAEPTFGDDPALGRQVASFDGTNAVRYDYADGFEQTENSVSIECTVRFDAPLAEGDSENSGNFCGAKDAGGYSLTAYGDTLKMMVNVDDTYYGAGVDIEEGVWYHVTGVWDGETVALYLNGEKVAEEPAEGEALTPPPETDAHQFFLGADVGSGGDPQFHGTVSLAQAAIHSAALDEEQVQARYAKTFADRTEDEVAFTLDTPPADSEITGPVELSGTTENEELLARPLAFTLDGEDVALGDEIGPGLAEGEHTLTYRGTDALGQKLEESFTFTSPAIPTGDGTGQQNGSGTAELSARATHPSGSQLRTTFLEGDVSRTDSTRQGTIDVDALDPGTGVDGDVEIQDAEESEDGLLPADGHELKAPATDQLPVLQTQVPITEEGQRIQWRGQVDPAREIHLLALNQKTDTYEILDSARGSSEEQIRLGAALGAEHDIEGNAQVLVLGTDPFADDIDEEVGDSFAKPDDVDFSLMHITDTQYLSEGATEPQTPEERAAWANAYKDSYRWLADHGEEHKVAYVAHTGDITETWVSPDKTDEQTREQSVKEFEFASETQKMVDETGIPNSVLPGNHDNLAGADTGTDSLYNEYFGAERYEELAESPEWQEAGAEYHPWKPGDNDNSYTLFTAGGQDFIALSLGYDVTDQEADWAKKVLDDHSGRDAILLTHAYLKPSTSPDGRNSTASHDGQIIQDRVLEKSPNVALVLAGHEHGVSIQVRKDVGEKGNNVSELLADYQAYEVDAEDLGLDGVGDHAEGDGLRFGASFFRLLQFDLDRGEVSVDTYSPHLDDFGATEFDPDERYDENADDFRIPVQFQGRTTTFTTDSLVGVTPTDEVIDEVVHDSGTAATATWEGLEGGEPYGWFAVSRDPSRDVDAAEVRELALASASDPDAEAKDSGGLEEGIVQLGVFTATGEDQGAAPKPWDPDGDQVAAGPEKGRGEDE